MSPLVSLSSLWTIPGRSTPLITERITEMVEEGINEGSRISKFPGNCVSIYSRFLADDCEIRVIENYPEHFSAWRWIFRFRIRAQERLVLDSFITVQNFPFTVSRPFL